MAQKTHRAFLSNSCVKAGIEAPIRDYTGDDPLAFVLSLNIHRRHLNATQLAFVASRAEEVEAERAKERMAAGGGDKKSGVQKIAHSVEDVGKARDKAAKSLTRSTSDTASVWGSG